MLTSNPNRGVYNDVFNLFRDEIKKLIDFGLKYKSILSLLEKELDCSLNYKTFMSWINRSIKQKNQISNNTLRNNSQTKKEEIKKEVTQEQKQDNIASNGSIQETGRKKKKSKNWKEVIFPQIEAACEGMRKANLRM